MLFNISYWVLLLIIDCAKAKSIYSNGVLTQKCRIHDDCTNLTQNCVCWNNECLCLESDGYERRYRRQMNFESLGIQMLGEACRLNDECRRTPVDGTKVCLENQCQCSTGHVPIDAYRCIRDFNQQSPANAPPTKLIELEELPGYGSLCSTNNDCQRSTAQLECFSGACVCLEGYVPLGKYLCYDIRGHGAPVIERSTHTSTLPSSEMVKSLDEICINDYQCRQAIPHSRCLNGKCVCVDGYASLDHDTCTQSSPIPDLKNNLNHDSTTPSSHYRSLLGGQCITNLNCHSIDARCLNNLCTCPLGSFPIDDWNCLKDFDSPKPQPTTTIAPLATTTITPLATTTIAPLTTTTAFNWWPWTPSSTTPQSVIGSNKPFIFRCLLNRQCINTDDNSHCTSSGRCVCNDGYKLDTTAQELKCVRYIIKEEDCD